MHNRTAILLLSFFVPTLILSVTQSLMATESMHPFHVCIAHMTWNDSEEHWELSIRIQPQDLERGMRIWRESTLPENATAIDRKRYFDGCSLEDDAFSARVVEYLQSEFFLRRTPIDLNAEEFERIISVSDRTTDDYSRLNWVGKETEKGWLWMHFEFAEPKWDPTKQKLWIYNRILIDVVEKQENSLVVERSRATKYSLQFKKGTLYRPLR